MFVPNITTLFHLYSLCEIVFLSGMVAKLGADLNPEVELLPSSPAFSKLFGKIKTIYKCK